MGTTVRLFLFDAPDDLEIRLRQRLNQLELAWSRFLPDSDVSRINAAAGEPVAVSADTVLLVSRALSASRRTMGWFDPTLLRQLEAAGYDRTFAELPTSDLGDLVITVHHRADEDVVRVHDWHAAAKDVELDADAQTVTVPVGVAFDPGGVGKGLAADLLAAEATSAGATAVLVDLGGDIVTAGQAPNGGWRINIEDPFDRATSASTIAVPWGAVATSSRASRRWMTPEGPAHHLIDPVTGTPATTDVAACTVVGGACWLAESYAKACVLAGLDVGLNLVADAGMEALMIDADGRQHTTRGMDGFAS